MIRLVLALALMLAAVGRASADCGDAGDPGYRGPDGSCVDWCHFEETCGPKGKSCRPEQVSRTIMVLQGIIRGNPSLPECHRCGCKGGPGYRAPSGRCVGWDRLNDVCGSPPASHCTAENVAASAGEVARAQADYAARRTACR